LLLSARREKQLVDRIHSGVRPMTDDVDATPAAPDPDDHVARLQAEIDAAKARRAGYRAEAAESVARGRPARATDEEVGIIKTDDTVGKIAADAGKEIRGRLSRVMSRFRLGRKK
jgi:hypothetical protein